MAIFEANISARRAGSMNDRIDPGQHDLGMLRMRRNDDSRRETWKRRKGWKKASQTAMPWTRCIGAYAYRDTAGTLHVVVVGDDSKIYHADGTELATDDPEFTEVTSYATDTWDGTYNACFAPWRDDLFIALSQPIDIADTPAASVKNLRFDGLAVAVFDVGIDEPDVDDSGMAATDNGVGNIQYGTFSYICTFLDTDTGWESAASDEVTIELERPDAPSFAPLLADGGAGSMAAGTFSYKVTFYHSTDSRESLPSTVMTITQEAAHQIDISRICVCPEAGAWHRRIYRSSNGGAYHLVHTIADNTTTTWTDNAAADGAAYAETARQIRLSNIPVFEGGGDPAAGRSIHRNIYRSDDGATHALIDTLEDNTTTTYDDNTESVESGTELIDFEVIPACAYVASNANALMLWGNDRTNVEPAKIYIAYSPDYPEAIGSDVLAGSNDDPITGLYSVRDGVVASKRRSWHYVPRKCEDCERILQDVGCVAWATIQNVGTMIAFLSPEGPRIITHYAEADVRFVGRDPSRFVLAETWESVVKDRLPYASSVHWPAAGCVIWFVQRCATWDETSVGEHNDTAIVWDYGCADAENPGGDVFILDLTGVDHGFLVPVAGSDEDEPWAAFACGFVGQLYEGEHGDGCDTNLTGTVVAADGTSVTLNSADLDDENVVGSILHINGGTGTRICRDVSVCENARALIVSQCGGGLTLAGTIDVDTTSTFWIGGFGHVIDLMVVDDDPDAVKRYLRADIQVV